MIANYGYEDGTGFYYIAIDDSKCVDCEDRQCLNVCPKELYALELNDWDDEVIVVKSEYCKQLQPMCADCKRSGADVPCISSCSAKAIKHTW